MNRKATKKYFIDTPLLAVVGKKIRDCRLSVGLSIEKLANECEVDPTQVGRMELGKVNFSISMLYKIAGALEVDAKKLLP